MSLSKDKLRKFITVLHLFRDRTSSDVQVSVMEALYCVGAYPGMSYRDLTERLNVSKSAITRVVDKLSIGTTTEPGLRWIMSQDDPTHRSTKRLYLTPKGEEILSHLMGIIEEVCTNNGNGGN